MRSEEGRGAHARQGARSGITKGRDIVARQREAVYLEGDGQQAAWEEAHEREQHEGRGHWTPDATPFAVRFEDDFVSVVAHHESNVRWQETRDGKSRRETQAWLESLASFKPLD